eukprot:gene14065-biopygen11123
MAGKRRDGARNRIQWQLVMYIPGARCEETWHCVPWVCELWHRRNRNTIPPTGRARSGVYPDGGHFPAIRPRTPPDGREAGRLRGSCLYTLHSVVQVCPVCPACPVRPWRTRMSTVASASQSGPARCCRQHKTADLVPTRGLASGQRLRGGPPPQDRGDRTAISADLMEALEPGRRRRSPAIPGIPEIPVDAVSPALDGRCARRAGLGPALRWKDR